MATRILHVVGGMNQGGVETWLMHVLRHINPVRFQMDFLVHTTRACAYDDEIRALGSKIIPCLHSSQPLIYARNFKRGLREHGPYQVVHSHVHHYSGYIVRLAYQMGVPVRIAHSHSDTSLLQAKARHPRLLYLSLMNRWIDRYATIGVAASAKAAVALFGSNWKSNPYRRLLFCGIDLLPFKESVNSKMVREELGLSSEHFIIGHVGNFNTVKNHEFLVKIASEAVKREPQLRLLLIGDGPLRPTIQKQVARAGLERHVVFAGSRPDVPRLMLGAMDAFMLPSLSEGLGLVLVEAQTSGLRCIFSDVVPEEADVVPPLVQRLSLAQPASLWAETVLATRGTDSPIRQMDALAIVEQGWFNIRTSVRELEQIYEYHSESR